MFEFQRVYVKIDRRTAELLRRLSEAERRHPSEQAALLLTRAVQQRQRNAFRVEVGDGHSDR